MPGLACRANNFARGVYIRVRDRIEKLERKLKYNEKRNESQALTSRRAREIDDTISLIKDQIAREKEILNGTIPYQNQKYQQREKRIAIKLIKENWMKNRKLGAGAKKLLHSEDGEYVARAIESMCSAHGRRTDHVMYLNHRLKCNDLLSIANHSLAFRGKKLIKSARTVLLRSRPKKINTQEGSRHNGNQLTYLQIYLMWGPAGWGLIQMRTIIIQVWVTIISMQTIIIRVLVTIIQVWDAFISRYE